MGQFLSLKQLDLQIAGNGRLVENSTAVNSGVVIETAKKQYLRGLSSGHRLVFSALGAARGNNHCQDNEDEVNVTYHQHFHPPPSLTRSGYWNVGCNRKDEVNADKPSRDSRLAENERV